MIHPLGEVLVPPHPPRSGLDVCHLAFLQPYHNRSVERLQHQTGQEPEKALPPRHGPPPLGPVSRLQGPNTGRAMPRKRGFGGLTKHGRYGILPKAGQVQDRCAQTGEMG